MNQGGVRLGGRGEGGRRGTSRAKSKDGVHQFVPKVFWVEAFPKRLQKNNERGNKEGEKEGDKLW